MTDPVDIEALRAELTALLDQPIFDDHNPMDWSSRVYRFLRDRAKPALDEVSALRAETAEIRDQNSQIMQAARKEARDWRDRAVRAETRIIALAAGVEQKSAFLSAQVAALTAERDELRARCREVEGHWSARSGDASRNSVRGADILDSPDRVGTAVTASDGGTR